jgi:hypothetical protein
MLEETDKKGLIIYMYLLSTNPKLCSDRWLEWADRDLNPGGKWIQLVS